MTVKAVCVLKINTLLSQMDIVYGMLSGRAWRWKGIPLII